MPIILCYVEHNKNNNLLEALMTPFKALTDIVVHGCTFFKAGDQVDALCMNTYAYDSTQGQDSILTKVDNYSLVIPKKFLKKIG